MLFNSNPVATAPLQPAPILLPQASPKRSPHRNNALRLDGLLVDVRNTHQQKEWAERQVVKLEGELAQKQKILAKKTEMALADTARKSYLLDHLESAEGCYKRQLLRLERALKAKNEELEVLRRAQNTKHTSTIPPIDPSECTGEFTSCNKTEGLALSGIQAVPSLSQLGESFFMETLNSTRQQREQQFAQILSNLSPFISNKNQDVLGQLDEAVNNVLLQGKDSVSLEEYNCQSLKLENAMEQLELAKAEWQLQEDEIEELLQGALTEPRQSSVTCTKIVPSSCDVDDPMGVFS